MGYFHFLEIGPIVRNCPLLPELVPRVRLNQSKYVLSRATRYMVFSMNTLRCFQNIDTIAARKPGIKAKLVCWAYPIQRNRAKYTGNNICQLCEREAEDSGHFLLRCNLANHLNHPIQEYILQYVISCEDTFLQIMLDVTHPSVPILLQVYEIKSISRGLCVALHARISDL
jgi:hypothetical protein